MFLLLNFDLESTFEEANFIFEHCVLFSDH